MARHNFEPDRLFRLIIKLPGGTAIVTAWEGKPGYYPNHTRVDCELRWRSATSTNRTKRGAAPCVFERGQVYVGIPGHQTIDGRYAREAVLSALAVKPGDTDSDYFEDYTPEQLEWTSAHGEDLSLEAAGRYGDERLGSGALRMLAKRGRL
jgi:hypothetical protein